MTDDAIAADSCCAAFCTLFIVSAIEPWCNTKRFGSGGCGCCGGPRGCCGSCFDGGFNKDSWDAEDARKQAGATPDGGDASRVVAQPEAVPEMKAVSADAKDGAVDAKDDGGPAGGRAT